MVWPAGVKLDVNIDAESATGPAPRQFLRGQGGRIGVCADTHYWPSGPTHRGSTGSLQLQSHSEELLATLLTELDAAQLDFVFHLGDLTCGGGYYAMTPAEFYAALEEARDGFAGLRAPCYALPGNHDCPPGGGNWSFFERLWGLTAGQGLTLDLPMARLVLLNAQGHSPQQIAAARPEDPVYGWVSADELDRLDEALATADGRPVIVFMHQLLRRWSGHRTWKEFYGVANAEAVTAIMARYGNVCAVFQGHAHMFDVQRVRLGRRSAWFVIAPAVIEHPLGWLELELTPGSLQLTLRTLPLPELSEMTRQSGDGQAWRAGKLEWQKLRIELA